MNSMAGTNRMLPIIAAVLIAFAALMPGRAGAWDYSVAGVVSTWQQYQGDGGIALLLAGAPDLCPNLDTNWARKRGYLSLNTAGYTADSYKAMFASLMEARISQRTIRLYV